MEIEIQITHEPIAERIPPPQWWPSAKTGAWLEFRGVVRDEENGQAISALEYEAYPEMAEREIRRILKSLAAKHACLAAKVIHRVGMIPVGETAIYVGVASPHRGEAIALLAEFMDCLKQDVPIWKRRALAESDRVGPTCRLAGTRSSASLPENKKSVVLSLDEARAEIRSRCQPLPGVRVPLNDALGHVLRETVCALEDLPDCDRSTRDGYAVLQNDASETFQVVDTLHAADWKPRELKTGQAVRIATGAPLPCENLRVVMQEHVERAGDQIRIVRRENGLNLRKRGEDVRAGEPLVSASLRLDAGKLALLASGGWAQPLVSPRLRIVHFTTGDEIVPPDQPLKPGQIRDSNSILIRSLLQRFPCELEQAHLPEDFEKAKSVILEFGDTSPLSSARRVASSQSADISAHSKLQVPGADVLLISGGASVGDKDFTRPLLEWLAFEIVFSQVSVRPGRPLVFGTNGKSIAFGLPGNPLSHFVCFHLFVATALARLVGAEPPMFQRGRLAAKLEDEPNPRETLWPARLDSAGLHPLKWSSSGDVTCLAAANALVRVPANGGSIEAGAEVDFLRCS